MTGRSANVLTGTRIRERRLALSRRQAEVARSIGISAAYLNLIEHNRRPVGPDLIARLAAELEVPADELAEGREEIRIAALREAAAHPVAVGTAPELDQVTEYLARYPGWSALLIAHARRAGGLERQLVDLSDRMTQDPYLLTTLHEILSAVTAVRSTAAILVEEGEISPEWRRRFHQNLHQDSQRLSLTAQALVAHLDSFEAEGHACTPQEEVEAWLAEAGHQVPDPSVLASDAARAMAAELLDGLQADRAALPDAVLAGAVADAGRPADPLRLAGILDLPLDLVMRRLADLRPPGFEGAGLLVCDGSGVLTTRRAAQGFALPRPGDSCALWPLYHALAVPQVALARAVVTPEGRGFRTLSYAQRHQPRGLDGPLLTDALMLLMPVDGPAPADALPIGPACRICPRIDCPARREVSILMPQAGPGGRA
ncbi:helix-turn-helix domain-containing protein [Paracoccus liaowanqingii]|uniref:Helix-turn-helix domain-containing protein n=1 Tax=Paracoccus liaowanqingii TaxID=2560053 RepID=A0A4P7HKS5_9RHOB|nr:short-chain fatty acyl-CoA regulator family protein [Paracoccus liaowanqingii]QBX34789.1 helix-turn-helix domain-containing protein [Paracoccus liaowanqingii]